MKKMAFMALFAAVMVFSVNSMACGGEGESKEKKDKKGDSVSLVQPL